MPTPPKKPPSGRRDERVRNNFDRFATHGLDPIDPSSGRMRHFDCPECRRVAYGRPLAQVIAAPARVEPGQAAFDFMAPPPSHTKRARGSH